MSVFENMKNKAKTLQNEIRELLKIDREELYGEKRLYDLSFKDYGKEQFEVIFSLIEDLGKCHFERVPEDKTEEIRRYLNIYKGIFSRSMSLNLKSGGDTKSQRDQIVSELENNYHSFFNAVASVINFVNHAGTDFKQIEREARQTLESTKNYSEKQKQQNRR